MSCRFTGDLPKRKIPAYQNSTSIIWSCLTLVKRISWRIKHIAVLRLRPWVRVKEEQKTNSFERNQLAGATQSAKMLRVYYFNNTITQHKNNRATIKEQWVLVSHVDPRGLAICVFLSLHANLKFSFSF